MSDIKFAAIGINHSHIYGQVDCLLEAGAQFTAFHAVEDDLAEAFGAKYPQAKRVADPRAILEDPDVAVVLTSAIPADRAAIYEHETFNFPSCFVARARSHPGPGTGGHSNADIWSLALQRRRVHLGDSSHGDRVRLEEPLVDRS